EDQHASSSNGKERPPGHRKTELSPCIVSTPEYVPRDRQRRAARNPRVIAVFADVAFPLYAYRWGRHHCLCSPREGTHAPDSPLVEPPSPGHAGSPLADQPAAHPGTSREPHGPEHVCRQYDSRHGGRQPRGWFGTGQLG